MFKIYYLFFITQFGDVMSHQLQKSISRSTTSHSSSIGESQKLIYYYSHFQLLQKRKHSLSYSKYNKFLIKLLRQLGDDWRFEADKLLTQKENYNKPSNGILFQYSMSIWLIINKMKKHISIDLQTQNESDNYDMQYFDLFNDKLHQLLSQQWKYLLKEDIQLNQLAMGFFMTANSTWEHMTKEDKNSHKSILKIPSDKNHQQSIYFKPLMLAKEKIYIFSNKKIKLQEEQIKKINYASFNKFKDNLEKDELQHQIDGIKIVQNQFESESQSPKRKRPSSQRKVVIQKIPQHNPISHNILRRAYSHIINSDHEHKLKWQVGKSFVTNILEINYGKLKKDKVKVKEQDRSDEESIFIRVLKPAQDFYHILMEAWLLFRSQSETKFQSFLSQIKIMMDGCWSDNYLYATKLFYCKLCSQWSGMVKGKEMAFGQDQQIIDIFVQRIRMQMRKNWEQDTIQKIVSLSSQGDLSK